MKRNYLGLSITLMCLGAMSLTSCSYSASTLLVSKAEKKSYTTSEKEETRYGDVVSSLKEFSYKLAEASGYSVSAPNLALSPLTVYLGLAALSDLASGDTKSEILNAFSFLSSEGEEISLTSDEIRECYFMLLNDLNFTYVSDFGKTTDTLALSNSIWLSDEITYKEDGLANLADNYYTDSYYTEFSRSKEANKDISSYIKENSNGLINKDFIYPSDTLLVYLVTLYIKGGWNDTGDNLKTSEKTSFTRADGSSVDTKLLEGYYHSGTPIVGEKYTSFYTATYGGRFHIKFIVPKDGYTLNDIYSQKVFKEVNSKSVNTDYNNVDEEKKIEYYTRVYFPEFKASYDDDVMPLVKDTFNINKLFDKYSCEMDGLTEDDIYLEAIRQSNELNVTRKGIEGVSSVNFEFGAGASGPSSYTEVYQDYYVDKAFLYILTDRNEIPLYIGYVNNI
ncbi:MAG: hypothetical protein LUB56_02885 [Coprobacillus sp.]|nr:hypothetical protein [Coprobacillus sp.]